MNKKLLNAMLVGAVAMSVAGLSAAHAADAEKENCVGVVKAGQNDCKGATNSCAGQSKADGEGWVALPKGVCEKLVNGKVAK